MSFFFVCVYVYKIYGHDGILTLKSYVQTLSILPRVERGLAESSEILKTTQLKSASI